MKAISVPTIPVTDAVLRVSHFRKTLSKSLPPENIPRAILIPIADLLAIVEKYSTVDEKTGEITCSLKGVRAYFAIKATDMVLPDDVTALIVPVNKEGDDITTNPARQSNGADDSEIYDFTKPCPSECDPDSPLYVP